MALTKRQFLELEGSVRETYDAYFKSKTDHAKALYNIKSPKVGQFTEYTIGAPGRMQDWNGAVAYDDFVGGYDVNPRAEKKSTGIQIPKDMYEDGEFDAIRTRVNNIAYGVDKTLRYDSAYVFNQATNTAVKGPDGLPLISASHLTVPGATAQSNYFAGTLCDYEGIEEIQLDMEDWTDDRGDPMNIEGNFVIAGNQQRKNLQKLFGSEKEAYVADNTINVDKGTEFYIHPLIRGKRFFVANKDLMMNGAGLNWFMRKDPRNIERDGDVAKGDFNTEMLSWKCVGRYKVYWLNWFFIAMGTGE